MGSDDQHDSARPDSDGGTPGSSQEPLSPEVLPSRAQGRPHLAPESGGLAEFAGEPVEGLQRSLVQAGLSAHLPALVQDSGASTAYTDFFVSSYDNEHTRRAYKRHVDRFLAWCERQDLRLQDLRAHHVGSYRDSLPVGPASKRQVLAALRKFFDPLVERHFCLLNPARATGNPRTEEQEGQTPEIPFEVVEAAIKATDSSTVVALRDRAVLAMLASTGCRIGAIASFNLSRYYYNHDQWYVKLHEKNSKVRDVPVRHDLQRIIHAYLEEAGLLVAPGEAPMFRTAEGRTGRLRPYREEMRDEHGEVLETAAGRITEGELARMLKRRLVDAGYGTRSTVRTPGKDKHGRHHTYTRYSSLYCPHSFRVTVLTDLIAQGEDIQDVAYLAGHSSIHTTQRYDRTEHAVKRNLVERIRVDLPSSESPGECSEG